MVEVEYPGGRRWTHGHVSSPIGHIVWTAYVSTDGPDEVTAFLAEKWGAPDRADGRATWRWPAEKPVDVVSVQPVESPGPHRDGTPVPAGARTVILASTMTR